MNLIQTLYFDDSIDPLQQHFGWVAPEYHLMSWTLSCLQLEATYGRVDLFGNSRAAELLTNKLGLPYRKAHISHDRFLTPNKGLWALPKIATYLLQQEPFIHLDGDVFLFKKLPDALESSELIAQNTEEASPYHIEVQKQIVEHLGYIPQCVKDDFKVPQPLKTLNAGIIGGKNIAFIHEFSNLAFRYVFDNVECLHKINSDKFNVFFEQHLFYCLAKEKKISVNLLFEDLVKNNDYTGLGDFHEAPFKRNYLHLLGNYKRDEFTCIQMASRLRDLYPEYFYRIISLFKKSSLKHTFRIYADKEFSSIHDYAEFNKNCISTYQRASIQSSLHKADGVTPVDYTTSSGMHLAKQMITEMDYFNREYTQDQLIEDFDLFTKETQAALRSLRVYSDCYLYGRDLEHEKWFSFLFTNDTAVRNQLIVCCRDIIIIESKFNWSGILNKFKRNGIRYYEQLELSNGVFYSVIVPEICEEGFSICEVDDLEKIIIDKLKSPMSMEDLVDQVKQYVWRM